jgi:hypothetical protein
MGKIIFIGEISTKFLVALRDFEAKTRKVLEFVKRTNAGPIYLKTTSKIRLVATTLLLSFSAVHATLLFVQLF